MSWDDSTTALSLNNNNVAINMQVVINLAAEFFDKAFGKGQLRISP